MTHRSILKSTIYKRSNLYLLLGCSLFIFLQSCINYISKEEKNEAINNSQYKNITLIFKKIPENYRLIHPKGGAFNKGEHEISYTLNGYETIEWAPESYLDSVNILILRNVENQVELNHKYKALDEFSYLLEPGDSVIFTYEDYLPIVEILNRVVKPLDYNIETFIVQKSANDALPDYLKLLNLGYTRMANMKEGIFMKDKELRMMLAAGATKELNSQMQLLNSLYRNKEVSDDKFLYYQNKLNYERKSLEILNPQSVEREDFIENSSFIEYAFYRNYLKLYLQSNINKYEKMKMPKSRTPDNRMVYDTITASDQLGYAEKKYLLFNNMKSLITYFAAKDVKKYFDQYKKSPYSDSLLVKSLSNEYNLEGGISKDLVLVDYKNREVSFEELLVSLQGNKIYVDFWASWCRPCRKAMPASLKLRKELANENVVFVYLSLNDKKENWVKASVKDSISDYQHSYFISNSRTTEFTQDHDIQRIPRYMIYNESGEVSYSNAPSPEDPRLRKYLVE